jgi:uncharacterized membrane protein YgcG
MHATEPAPQHTVRRHVRLARTLALVTLWAVCGVLDLTAARPALGQASGLEPPRLQGQVVDQTQAQVLRGDRATIDAALAELREGRNVQLFVLFVESTGSLTVTDYADEVARRSSLGGNDALLVVALADRSDALWRGSLLRDRLTDRELETILSERVEPLLARSDFGGAVVASVDGLAEAVAADGGAAGVAGGLGSITALAPLVALVVLVVGGLWLWSSISGRRRQRRAAEQYARQTEQLEQQASALLIAADEAVREADDDLRFAELQFGEPEIARYRDAVAQASKELEAAFTLRQQLDDDVPEAPEARRRLVEQMVVHAQQARTALDEQRQRIDELREVERRAPEILAGLPAQLDALEARIPETERIVASLERYAEQSRASVAGNVDQARQRLAEARASGGEGQAALAANDRAAAGRSARSAQQAQAEIAQLLDAVASLADALRQAEATAGQQVSAASADVETARAALAAREVAGRGAAELDRRLDEAEGALRQARRELAAPKPDFPAAARLATHADTVADEILAEVRQDDERRDRERRILEAQLQTAEASYTRAQHFVTARHRGMGSTARTRLAGARRHLEQAAVLADSDPRTALAEARRAQALADEAYALAQQDFDGYGGWGGLPRGGPFPVPFPMPMGGGWGGGFSGGGFGGGGSGGGGGGGSVGGRW